MKKILFLFALINLSASAQITVKSIGIDSATGLSQQLNVWQLTIDAKSKKIAVVYNIQVLAPNGAVVSTGDNLVYFRYNKPAHDTIPADNRFDLLKASPLGQGIIANIVNDLVPVSTINDLKKLEQ